MMAYGCSGILFTWMKAILFVHLPSSLHKHIFISSKKMQPLEVTLCISVKC